jgi:hypothetical protein
VDAGMRRGQAGEGGVGRHDVPPNGAGRCSDMGILVFEPRNTVWYCMVCKLSSGVECRAVGSARLPRFAPSRNQRRGWRCLRGCG